MGAGVIVLIFLALHMGIMHLDGLLGLFNPAGGNSVDWANVVSRARSAFFTLTYIILLGAALYHGLYGFRTIVFELDPPRGLKRAVSWSLAITGLLLFSLGTWAAFVGFRLAQST
jgi:succinate dehydrogenase / fumarate reductase membrane anchor subunit